ncbi:MAG: tRNA preQ1(34) S-adenosylmethionine ribosyltransferase-isomerase QueA [Vulcanimicrobiota bacterium]
MELKEFDYHLPPELIAQEPLTTRDESRLMVLDRSNGTILHRHFRDITGFLPSDSLLVMNNSKVIPARLFCRKDKTGGNVEVLLTRQTAPMLWEGLVRPGRRVQPGCRLIVEEGVMEFEVISRGTLGGRTLSVHCEGDFWELLERHGHTPLPPYIKKSLLDPARYQTVYASVRGSVAAPTAGLHFTPSLFSELKKRNIDNTTVTLHIGPGTFRQVKAEIIEEHSMESEYFTIDEAAASQIDAARKAGRRIFAVGTTSVRTLESAHDREGVLQKKEGHTELFIYPGFRFSVVQGLITNFHLPRSTLLMLVSAFAGTDLIRRAYQEAIREKYRFYSLGDAMLIL